MTDHEAWRVGVQLLYARSTYICALCRLLETYLAVPTNSNSLIAICDGMCDVEKKTYAYNMDPPHAPEVYAHTSGVCGRSMLYAYVFFLTSHMPSQISMSKLQWVAKFSCYTVRFLPLTSHAITDCNERIAVLVATVTFSVSTVHWSVAPMPLVVAVLGHDCLLFAYQLTVWTSQ